MIINTDTHMSFCQATTCFYFHGDSDGGQEIIPSKDINQIIFEDPLSGVARTLWMFEDPDDPENKVYIAKFKQFGNFGEEFFESTLNADVLYHLDSSNPPENIEDTIITDKTATLYVVGKNNKCQSISGFIQHKPQSAPGHQMS